MIGAGAAGSLGIGAARYHTDRDPRNVDVPQPKQGMRGQVAAAPPAEPAPEPEPAPDNARAKQPNRAGRNKGKPKAAKPAETPADTASPEKLPTVAPPAEDAPIDMQPEAAGEKAPAPTAKPTLNSPEHAEVYNALPPGRQTPLGTNLHGRPMASVGNVTFVQGESGRWAALPGGGRNVFDGVTRAGPEPRSMGLEALRVLLRGKF